MSKLRTLLLSTALAAALSTTALLAACGGGDKDNLFVGTWFAPDGATITFSDKTWQDSDGDAGDYSFTGEYPDFMVTFVLPSGPFARMATFIDRHTLELCEVFVSGAIGDCVTLTRDRPIAPG